jgi:hypothetical protein
MEPVLAEDKYGEAAVASLGFSIEEISIFDRAARFVRYLAEIASAPDRSTAAPPMPPPPAALARGLCALAAKLKRLEEIEPMIVHSLAELAAKAQRRG